MTQRETHQVAEILRDPDAPARPPGSHLKGAPAKLSRSEAQRFWQDVHARTGNSLAAVCHPDKSWALNGLFAWTQRYAIARALDSTTDAGEAAQVLKVGCGRGRWLRFFQSRGSQVHGVDISEPPSPTVVPKGMTSIMLRSSSFRLKTNQWTSWSPSRCYSMWTRIFRKLRGSK